MRHLLRLLLKWALFGSKASGPPSKGVTSGVLVDGSGLPMVTVNGIPRGGSTATTAIAITKDTGGTMSNVTKIMTVITTVMTTITAMAMLMAITNTITTITITTNS